jgi:hypothetical protein
MAFDIEATFQAMAEAAGTSLEKESQSVRDALHRVLEDQRQALADIAAARLAGDIDDEQLEVQLDDEKIAFRAGLSMVKAITKATVQKAANAAFDVLIRAIRAAI